LSAPRYGFVSILSIPLTNREKPSRVEVFYGDSSSAQSRIAKANTSKFEKDHVFHDFERGSQNIPNGTQNMPKKAPIVQRRYKRESKTGAFRPAGVFPT
jgi:hypothetical protein